MSLKFFLLGASHSDFYLAYAIKRLGYSLFTSGNYANGLINCFSDKFFPADYSDLDSSMNVFVESGADYLIPSANDFSYLTACKINDFVSVGANLDSYQTALILHRKDLFRLLCAQLSLPAPKLYAVLPKDSIETVSIQYPCVVKPVDLTGGKGVFIAQNLLDLRNYLDSSSGSTSKLELLVVEEYVPGHLYSCSGVIKEGKVELKYFDKEFLNDSKFSVGSSSSNIAVEEMSKLNSLTPCLQVLSDNLSLKDGLLHVQVIISSLNGLPSIVEITRRMPGDLYSIPVEITSNFNHAMSTLSIWTGISGFESYSLLDDLSLKFGFESHLVCNRYQVYDKNRYDDLKRSVHGRVLPFLPENRFGLKFARDEDYKGVLFDIMPLG